MKPKNVGLELNRAHRSAHGNRSDSKCPSCTGQATKLLYRVPSIPVHSSILVESAEAARSLPRRDLELAFCNKCGFGFNQVFDTGAIQYSADFEESQHFSDTFNSFARSLAREIASKANLKGKHVLEIGCGKGEFLIELCDAGDATGIGIDPAYRADVGRSATQRRVKFIADLFSEKYKDLSADAVLCRHTLEHIAPVREFICAIRQMIGMRDDVWVVFETPDFKRVLREVAFWDIYYEHCSYFSPGAHAQLFRHQGFDVTSLELAYCDQYIVQYAKPAKCPTKSRLALEADLVEMRAHAERFADVVSDVRHEWRRRICDAHNSGRSVVLWGGGSKAVSFLTTLSIGPEVQAVVDINPYKQGKFTPGTAHPVIAPRDLLDNPPDVVIVMNPVYVPEITRILESLELKPEIVPLQAHQKILET